ncbi:hypothetical protein XA68_16874 [Ophiocordyceps unilateralis]|uniref:Uncharacterized protein n=1 Tax=Ophiocordyceps unilateralis TaxID=268505 RepID=A0A2A9PL47_OPHUN|nr:hypothetical protein XA68_16874 [Ophiocordyceps unilateralis]
MCIGTCCVPRASPSKQRIQHAFRQGSSLEPSSNEAQAAIKHGKDIARFLRTNVVQGWRDGPEDNTYKLRIHEHTERGDNESIGNSCRRQRVYNEARMNSS